jgi:hypothetical protein
VVDVLCQVIIVSALFLESHRVFGPSNELLRENSSTLVDDRVKVAKAIVWNDGVNQPTVHRLGDSGKSF